MHGLQKDKNSPHWVDAQNVWMCSDSAVSLKNSTSSAKCKEFVLKVVTGRHRADTQRKEPIHIIGIDIGPPETSSTTSYIYLIHQPLKWAFFLFFFTASPYYPPRCAQLAAISSLP